LSRIEGKEVYERTEGKLRGWRRIEGKGGRGELKGKRGRG